MKREYLEVEKKKKRRQWVGEVLVFSVHVCAFLTDKMCVFVCLSNFSLGGRIQMGTFYVRQFKKGKNFLYFENQRGKKKLL